MTQKLEEARKLYQTANADQKYVLESLFPELKESEDERIRKALIEYFNAYPKDYYGELKKSHIFAWLEKQGEQKEINLVEILKHYPRETELYSPLYGKLWLAEVDEEHEIITCYKRRLSEGCTRAILKQEDTVSFYSNGTTGLPDCSITKDCMLFLYNNEKQGEQKPIDKIQLGKKYKCIASPRYSTFMTGEIYKPKDKFLCSLMNFCSDCFEPVEDGEQKPTDKVEPKFKVGDWVVHDMSDGRKVIRQIVNMTNKSYVLNGEDFNTFYFNDLENDYHLWTIQDAKDGDVLFMNNVSANCIFIYKSSNNGIINKYASYNKFGFESEHYLVLNDGYVIPATKEQRDLLFSKMKEAGYEWDAEKKELKKIKEPENFKNQVMSEITDLVEDYFTKKSAEWSDNEGKQIQINPSDYINDMGGNGCYLKNTAQDSAWSEEDEKHYQGCLNLMKLSLDTKPYPYYNDYLWLKSLKERYTWKPSDEQLNNILDVLSFDNCTPKRRELLESLYEQLKKL